MLVTTELLLTCYLHSTLYTFFLRLGQYLLLTEFEVGAVSYGPSFFPLAWKNPSAKRVVGHKSTGKNKDP